MRVFIQRGDDGEFISEPCYVAYHGFAHLGWEICSFKDALPTGLSREDVVVGWIGSVKTALKNLGITPPLEFDYPEELRGYLGRKIWMSTMHKTVGDMDNWPVFVKSAKGKMVDGFVLAEHKDIVGRGQQEDFDVWCSEVVKFETEYRCFIRYGQIVDARKYKGRFDLPLDRKIVEACIADFKSAPASYTLDFGITADGRTLLVEVNDGYAMGSYGLFSLSYAKCVSARWHEMVNIPDPLKLLKV